MLLAFLLALQVATPRPAEMLVEVRVHGNYATPESTILALAGLAVDTPFSDQALADAKQRLVASGRFERVDVLKRFRSIEDASQILVVIVVDERPGASDEGPPGALQRWLGGTMWAPLLGFEDGYGLTYGARITIVDGLGPRSRLSVPLSWGGERRAALELDRRVDGPVVSRVFGATSIDRRENPHFEIGDVRRTVSVGADRALTPWLTAEAGVRLVHVAFGDLDASHNGVLTRLTVDTRADPAFPRNAVVGQVGWERLGFAGRPPVHRLSGRGQAFLGVVGPAVVAVSAGLDRATAPVPPYEQRLLGGGRSIRGLRAGAFAGDSIAVASMELRVPVTSPLAIGRVGLKAFADAGTVWNAGERLVQQRWHRGAGGGVFVTWTALVAGLDVARGEGGVRVHAMLRFGDPRSR